MRAEDAVRRAERAAKDIIGGRTDHFQPASRESLGAGDERETEPKQVQTFKHSRHSISIE